jgi:hypothetical protein
MDQKLLARIDPHVIGWGVLISLGAVFLFDLHIALSVGIGAVIAIANWVGFRWIGGKIVASDGQHRARYAILLALKMTAVLAVIGLVLKTGKVDVLAFLIGLSALVLGVLSRSAMLALMGGEPSLREEDSVDG